MASTIKDSKTPNTLNGIESTYKISLQMLIEKKYSKMAKINKNACIMKTTLDLFNMENILYSTFQIELITKLVYFETLLKSVIKNASLVSSIGFFNPTANLEDAASATTHANA